MDSESYHWCTYYAITAGETEKGGGRDNEYELLPFFPFGSHLWECLQTRKANAWLNFGFSSCLANKIQIYSSLSFCVMGWGNDILSFLSLGFCIQDYMWNMGVVVGEREWLPSPAREVNTYYKAWNRSWHPVSSFSAPYSLSIKRRGGKFWRNNHAGWRAELKPKKEIKYAFACLSPCPKPTIKNLHQKVWYLILNNKISVMYKRLSVFAKSYTKMHILINDHILTCLTRFLCGRFKIVWRVNFPMACHISKDFVGETLMDLCSRLSPQRCRNSEQTKNRGSLPAHQKAFSFPKSSASLLQCNSDECLCVQAFIWVCITFTGTWGEEELLQI